jgi:hypothetical protein
MELSEIIAIGVGVAVIIAIAGWAIYGRRRSRQLREHFGPEYDRTVTAVGDQSRAESELAQREERIRRLQVRSLTASDRQRFLENWRACQAQFVDDPAGAVRAADNLVVEIMKARGYAFDDPRQRLADISAAYPRRTEEYREATFILAGTRSADASTEDLRKAFVHYRALFDELLGDDFGELRRAS